MVPDQRGSELRKELIKRYEFTPAASGQPETDVARRKTKRNTFEIFVRFAEEGA